MKIVSVPPERPAWPWRWTVPNGSFQNPGTCSLPAGPQVPSNGGWPGAPTIRTASAFAGANEEALLPCSALALVAVLAVLAFVALSAVPALGTLPSFDSLIWVPVKVLPLTFPPVTVLFLSFLPAIVLFLMFLPLMSTPAAKPVPPRATNSASSEMASAGEGRPMRFFKVILLIVTGGCDIGGTQAGADEIATIFGGSVGAKRSRRMLESRFEKLSAWESTQLASGGASGAGMSATRSRGEGSRSTVRWRGAGPSRAGRSRARCWSCCARDDWS